MIRFSKDNRQFILDDNGNFQGFDNDNEFDVMNKKLLEMRASMLSHHESLKQLLINTGYKIDELIGADLIIETSLH